MLPLALPLACSSPGSDPPAAEAPPVASDPADPIHATALPTAPPCRPAAGIVLNEVSPANRETLLDVEGDSVDWVELTNTDEAPVDLSGWTLSDEPDEPAKWAFPPVVLEPGAFLLVHASDKDRSRVVGRWEARIDQGHLFRYLAVTGATDPAWILPEYDDGHWPEGPSGFGRGDSDDATDIEARTAYVRTTFTLTREELDDLAALVLHVDFDDGFAAYLNGVEVARFALGLAGSGPPAWDALAAWPNEAAIPQGGQPRYFDLDGAIGLLREGANTLALEVHDATPDSSDLTLLPILSFGFATPGEGRPSALVELPLVDLHASFALRASGEPIRLFDPAGCAADELDPETPLRSDESYGRQPDGTGALGYFLAPTPGAPNLTESRPGFAATPVFDPPPGHTPGGAAVTVTADPGAVVRAAWGGWEPTEADPVVAGPLHTGAEGEGVVVRARAWQDGLWPSRIATATYLLEPPGDLPVVSLVTDPPNLWDDEIGIYALGSNADEEYPWYGANFYQDWERPVHFAEWEPDGTLGFAVDGGVSIHGGNSRRHEQKNLEVSLGGGWGDEEIAYRVFPDLELDTFTRLVLRAGGGDWLGCYAEGCMGGAMFRDPLMQAITVGTDLDRMAARPVRAYLNGEYWGLYFLNEKADLAYVVDHHGEEEVDLLRNEGVPRQGDEQAWLELLEWLRASDLADPATYDEVRARIDVDELQTYLVFQIFFDNNDWPGNNIEYWRPRAEDGRWRWLLFGTDMGLGVDGGSPDDDTLALALAPDGDGWPNPPWSTELFRLLVQSPEFTDTFVVRYADYLNTLLLPERTQGLAQEFADTIAPEIPRHAARWGAWTDGVVHYALEGHEWAHEVEDIEAWLAERPDHAREHLIAQFGLAGTWSLALEADPPGSGTFALSTVTVEPPFAGTYFQGVPITITAVPAPGYTFAGWSDPTLPAVPTVTVDRIDDLALVARFQ